MAETSQRVDPFAGVDEDLDLDGLALSTRRPARPNKAETKAAAELMGFKSREAAAPTSVDVGQRASPRSKKSTKEQFNVRAERADIDRLYAIAEQKKWLLGVAFGEAVAALAEKLETVS